MKVLRFIFLLVPLLSFAQADKNTSVISVENVSVVYCGIDNPIKIAVPGAKSFIAFTEKGNLKKIDSLGNFNWNVTSAAGTEGIIKIEAEMQDGSVLHEEKEYLIVSLNHVKTVVNDRNYIVCSLELTKEDLINAIIGLKVDDCYIENGRFPIEGFTIYLLDQYLVSVEGNKFDEDAIKKIKNLKKGTIITICADSGYDNWPTPVKVLLRD